MHDSALNSGLFLLISMTVMGIIYLSLIRSSLGVSADDAGDALQRIRTQEGNPSQIFRMASPTASGTFRLPVGKAACLLGAAALAVGIIHLVCPSHKDAG